MFKFLAPLLGGLVSICSSLVGRVLVALGMGYVTYKGIDVTMGWVLANIKANMAGIPSETVGFLAYMGVDKAISMVFSAYSAAALIRMAGGTSITKLITKSPPG